MKSYADPAAIEKQLRKTQQEVSPNEARTSLFNLVVYTDKDDARLTEALNELHGKRPSRVIIVRRHSGGETRADAMARCVSEGDKVLCIQEILISSGDDNAGEAPETWTPLLIREIPVFVWWLSELDKAPVPELFDDIADRVFVDSSLSADPLAFLGRLAHRKDSLKTPVTDFTWSRVAPLLKLTANAFNATDRRPYLAELASVTFEGGETGEVALYFQWLKNKLNWMGASATTGRTWTLTDETGKSVSLVHKKASPLSQGFTASFQTRSGVTIKLSDTKQGYAVAEGTGLEQFTTVLRHQAPGEALINELDKNASDRLFTELLSNWS